MIREILEKYVVKDAIKEWQFMLDIAMPLKGSVLETNYKVQKAFRTDSIDSLKRLARQQGRKIQVPAFFIGSQGVAFGIYHKPEILVELKGKAAIYFPQDAHTQLSRNGYRWIYDKKPIMPFREKMAKEVAKYFRKYFKEKVGEVPGVIKKLGTNEVSTVKGSKFLLDEFTYNSEKWGWDGKEKYKFIKWYFDTAKDILKKTSLEIAENIYFYNQGQYDNDEVLVTDYEITGIWAIEDELMKRYNTEELNKYISDLKEEILKFSTYCGVVNQEMIEWINVFSGSYPKCELK